MTGESAHVTAADHRAWGAATSLADAADVNARWLEGEVRSRPGTVPNCGPDPEMAPLAEILAAVNRAGYLTDSAQIGCSPGPGADGARWSQRAAVQGYIHEGPLFDELVARVEEAGMFVIVNPSPVPRGLRVVGEDERWRGGEIVATARDGQPVMFYGRRWSNPYLDGGLCSPEAGEDIERAVYLSLLDREFSDRDLLWRIIARAVRETAGSADR